MKNKAVSFILAACLTLPCFFALNACGDKPQEELHTHTWATAWSNDHTHHWYACDGCNEKKNKADHDGDTCSVCGYEQAHTCTYDRYVYDREGHWQRCHNCEATTSKKEHTFLDNVCSVCGYEQGGQRVDTCAGRDLEIITIRDGQGVATLVKLPDGTDMLIDSGCSRYEGVTENLLYDHVEDLTIEHFVLTSTDSYHTGAAASIFIYFTVLNFYRPNVKSGHESASQISSTYNSGDSPYVENCEQYAATLEWLSHEEGCTTYVVDDINCDFTYEFMDYENNYHSYAIDFITPIAVSDRNSLIDNGVMVSIEYNDTVTLITGYTSNNVIDTYCNAYGTQKDVDVLITYWVGGEENKYAISRSDLRGTNFLEKINLTKEDYAIFAPIAVTSGYAELIDELHVAAGVLHNLNVISKVTTKVTVAGELTVTAE